MTFDEWWVDWCESKGITNMDVVLEWERAASDAWNNRQVIIDAHNSKREDFAKAAMQGLLSNPGPPTEREILELLGVPGSQFTNKHLRQFHALRAVEYADALLAALEDSKDGMDG